MTTTACMEERVERGLHFGSKRSACKADTHFREGKMDTAGGQRKLLDDPQMPTGFWYVAAASAELKGEPIAVWFFGSPVVLFRQTDGAPVALHDRCPHRGVALSLGRTTESTIECAYHGWRFGADGACRHIPSLVQGRDIPQAIGVRAFPCVETDGFVWLWAGDGPPTSFGPDPIAGFADRIWLQGVLDMACEAILPIENNLDLCHAYFTHPNLHPQYFAVQALGFRDQEFEVETTRSGLEVRWGNGPEASRLGFDLPDRVTIGDHAAEMVHVVLHHVPTTPKRCRQFWLLSSQRVTTDAPHSVTWVEDTPELFDQDRRVLESVQRARDQGGIGFERSVEADAPTLLVRRVIELARKGRWPAASASDRRTVRVRT